MITAIIPQVLLTVLRAASRNDLWLQLSALKSCTKMAHMIRSEPHDMKVAFKQLFMSNVASD